MEWIAVIERKVCGSSLKISAGKIGQDILLTLEGGEKPHIGCVVQAVPRLSLTGDGSSSATASVLNLTGHKDELLLRKLAEEICRKTGCVTVAAGGFHQEKITGKQIEELMQATDAMGKELMDRLLKEWGE